MSSLNNKKAHFVGLNERNVLPQVGQFGESLAKALLHGEVVSLNDEYPFADVVNHDSGLAIEAKMSNWRHAQRILPKQVNRLHEEVSPGFLFQHGIYVLIFYRGIHYSKGRFGKSKIWSRKISRADRGEILAQELQYIYIVDVKFLNYLLSKHSHLLKAGAIVSSEGKSGREKVLYLNRTTLASLSEEDNPHPSHLQRSLIRRRQIVFSEEVKLKFRNSDRLTKRSISVRYIGSVETGEIVRGLLKSLHPSINLNTLGQEQLVSSR